MRYAGWTSRKNASITVSYIINLLSAQEKVVKIQKDKNLDKTIISDKVRNLLTRNYRSIKILSDKKPFGFFLSDFKFCAVRRVENGTSAFSTSVVLPGGIKQSQLV